ncbi:hypothetical protein CYMTET_41536 [Cymbomonas tetramitiformis]|uniref:Uncharacterized protein n=1 Tax=Cymbomonas tetramitiformis TaxID=36881 RepID=A0AAE0C5W1_9CHLO|nr:hypothetical protein CYMTET_41536 [Cymbomonas tetramitiformis]
MSARHPTVSAAARRSLATIFDDAAARHATTPATPLVTAAPAANSAAATFLSNVKSLTRDHFNEKVAKLVIRKVYEDKTQRFSGAESNVHALFAKLVLALRTAFTAEESAFGPLFDLEDASLPVRSEANRLIFSTLELIVHPTSPAADWIENSAESHPFDGKRALFEIARMLLDAGGPFQGTADLLSIKLVKDINPLSTISAFNAALRSARRNSTLNDEEVKPLFIKALDPVFYAPVVNRLLLHDQRAAESLATIQQWTRECYSQHSASGTAHGFNVTEDVSAHSYSENSDFRQIFSDVQNMMCGMKREIKNIKYRLDSTKGFTPRGEKHGRGPKLASRFGAEPLKPGGNISQTAVNKKVAFHKGTGEFVPLCRNSTCTATGAKHWHRDCPHGGPRGSGEFGAHEFSVGTPKNGMYATLFQSAVESGDNARFEAVCYLADESDIVTFADNIGFSVVEKPPTDGHAAGSDTVVFAGLRPEIDVSANQSFTFADKMATAFAEKPLHMNYIQDVSADNSDLLGDSTDAEDSDGEDVHLPPPVSLRGCGRPLPGFGKSGLLGLLVCSVFLLCAAVPIAATAFGDGHAGDMPAPPVGGAFTGCSRARATSRWCYGGAISNSSSQTQSQAGARWECDHWSGAVYLSGG